MWFVDNQDMQGAWTIACYNSSDFLSQYSAMAQGQAISVLIRAFQATCEKHYLHTAQRAAAFMIDSRNSGGTTRFTSDGVIFEEYPKKKALAVLNGWIHALMGLYEFSFFTDDQHSLGFIDESLHALSLLLPNYDLGYWSRYDLNGGLASVYYQKEHIGQLTQLGKIFSEHTQLFNAMADKFHRQFNSFQSRSIVMRKRLAHRIRHRFTPDTVWVRH